MIGRIPILDVRPVVSHGQWPAKAVTCETFEVSATVFREGHEMLGAGVVLRHPDGSVRSWVRLHELAPGTDRLGAGLGVNPPGHWGLRGEAWGGTTGPRR